jgi:virulence-associated protein VapD
MTLTRPYHKVIPQKASTFPPIGHNTRRMRPPVTYAISFDLDTLILQDVYPGTSWNNAYADIRNYLEANGFTHQQGSVYFGSDDIDVVTCVMVAQNLASEFAWFEPAVRDIRMLRIEENNDLMPALKQGTRRSNTKKS